MSAIVGRRLLGRRTIELSDLLVWGIVVALLVVNTILQPSFLSGTNIRFVFSSSLVLIFAAAAVTLVIVIAEIDLALGTVLSMITVLIARYASSDPVLAVVLALCTGIACELIAGALVAYLRLPSIIVTLALSIVWGGVALSVMSQPGGSVPQVFANMMNGDFPIIATVVLAAVGIWFEHTGLGRRLFGLGSDELGAKLSGIPLVGTKLWTFGLAGLLLGISGVCLAGVTSAGDPLAGSSYTLTAITSAVLGGVAFSGGRGTITGAIGGALVLTLITDTVQLTGVSSFYSSVVDGALLIASLVLSRAATGRWIRLGIRDIRTSEESHA